MTDFIGVIWKKKNIFFYFFTYHIFHLDYPDTSIRVHWSNTSDGWAQIIRKAALLEKSQKIPRIRRRQSGFKKTYSRVSKFDLTVIIIATTMNEPILWFAHHSTTYCLIIMTQLSLTGQTYQFVSGCVETFISMKKWINFEIGQFSSVSFPPTLISHSKIAFQSLKWKKKKTELITNSKAKVGMRIIFGK